MKIIRNKFIPFPGFKAINLFGVLFARPKARLSDVDINHETIHSQQVREVIAACAIITIPLWVFGLWWLALLLSLFSFYIWYVVEFIVMLFGNSISEAYKAISFEQEAYSHEHNLTYLQTRKPFAFIKHI